MFRLTLSLGVAQQMSHGVSRVTDEAVTAQLVPSEVGHLTRVPATHPPSSDAPHTSPMMKPTLSFTRLRLLTSSIPTLRIIFFSGFFVPPAHAFTQPEPPHPTPHPHHHHHQPFSSPRQAAVADGRPHHRVALDVEGVSDLLGQRASLGCVGDFGLWRSKSKETKVLFPFL